MTPEQYEHLTELFHAALNIAPNHRAAFLDKASGGDPELRRELQSLLAAHEQHTAYTQKPLDDIAAGFCQAQQDRATGNAFSPNTRLDHYEIHSLLRKGGMSEVYLAEDLRLHRKVALKILPAEVASSQDRMRRFKQEAQAAAALNHPNIAHIYEIGESENIHYIALEYIDGDTLRDRMRRDNVQAEELLNYLIQVAEGLSKAHLAGIVHRDLKPENIMITSDGYAKILDFGLAKLIESQRPLSSGSFASDEVTTAVTTQYSLSGTVMGTVGYMSPEQAQGRVTEIDHRSDIFSFGCILFEGLTGQRPFEDTPVTDSLRGVVYESLSIKNFNPSVPPDLERIIRLCVAKDREQRYQTINDVAKALKEIRLGMGQAAKLDPTDPPMRRSLPLSAAITSATLIIVVSAVAYFLNLRLNRAPAWTEQDRILIADFDNKTDDTEFDGTLKQALIVQLQQSPFLTIFSDDRVKETLAYMKRSPAERLTPETAREICEREGLKAMLTGSIAPLGAHYYLTLEVIDSRTGEALARTQREVDSKEGVLRALDEAATELRQKLGESLTSIQKFDAPLERTTTSSLEALKDFSLAMAQTGPDASQKRIALYKRAIELDPDFALAYARLSIAYARSLESRALGREAAQKAFELRDRVSEWERFDISIRYYQFVTVEWDKVVETAQLWTSAYPNKSPQPYNVLAMSYLYSGQYQKAIEAANEALRLSPTFEPAYISLGQAFMGLNRFPEAKKTFAQALAQKFDAREIRRGLYELAFIGGDTAAMQQQLDAIATPSDDLAVSWQAETAASAGQWGRAQELFHRAIDLGTAKETGAQHAAAALLWNATLGQCQQREAEVAQVLTLPRYRASFPNLGLGLALCGNTKHLNTVIAEVKERVPKNTFTNTLYLPMIQAASEIKNNRPALALQTLETIRQYEAMAGFWPRYLRGQAYLRLKRGTEAAIEFQSILDHRGEDALSPLYPLAHLGLARAAALTGDSARSRKAYEDFFALWKEADARLRVLIEAKKEYQNWNH